MPYSVIDHTADIGIEVRADSREGLFSEAAIGFTDLLTPIERIFPLQKRTLELWAGDEDELLVRWLSELLYLFDAERRIFCKFDIQLLGKNHLRASMEGEGFDPSRHEICHDIKAVTYHRAHIHCEGREWKARVIFDI